MLSTRTAQIYLTNEGYVVVEVFPNLLQSIEDAEENIEACCKVRGAKERPILVDISKSRPLIPEVRHYYSGKILTAHFKALALLVSGQPLGIMMGNVYFQIAKPGIPKKLFTDKAEAIAWALKYV